MNLTCETQVYGNIEPVLILTNSGGASNQYNNGVNIGATASVQAQIPTVPSYACSTKFSALTNPEQYDATNIPVYTSNCTTQPLQVLCKYILGL